MILLARCLLDDVTQRDITVIVILIIPGIIGIVSPLTPVERTGHVSSSSDPICSGSDLGGFYQETLTARQPVIKQVDDVRFTLTPQYRYWIIGNSEDGRIYAWGTSTTRSDLGEKSCELVYVETFQKYAC